MEGRERGVSALLAVLGAVALVVPAADAWHVLVGGGVGATLGWLAAVDLRTHRVPNQVVLPALAVLTAVLGLWALAVGDAARLLGAVGGGAGVALALLALALATRGGLGLGDVKLGALVGVWSGWLDPLGPAVVLVVAFAVGGAVALGALLAGRAGPATRVPFGPFLAIGAAAATWWTGWGF